MNFEEILSTYHIEYVTEGNHHCRPGWIQLDCPFCGRGSNKFHMGYSLSGRFVNCWKCGPHPLYSTLQLITSLPPAKIASLLKDLRPEHVKLEPVRGRFKRPTGVEGLTNAHRKYLIGRGFDPDSLVNLWRISGIGQAGRLSWRIYIPIHYRGEEVSYTTRAIKEDVSLRYISASKEDESLPHKELLYGEDFVRDTIIVHEGPTDVWRTGPGAVATLGTAYTNAQILRIAKYPVRVICLDNEKEAQKRANTLSNLLSLYPGETYNVVLKGKDSASSSEKEIRKLRRRFL